MVRVTMWKDKEGQWHGFEVEGHAAFAPCGEDIVCAAVSILAQTTVLSLQKIVGMEPEVNVSEGYLTCRLGSIKNEKSRSDAVLLLSSLALGLEETARNYPGYLQVIYE